jgi:hypothetical protein
MIDVQFDARMRQWTGAASLATETIPYEDSESLTV